MARYELQTISTAGVDGSERAEYWRELVCAFHSLVDISFPRPDAFDGVALRQRTASHQLIGWRSDELRVVRTARQARSTGDGSYKFMVPVSGVLTVGQDGRRVCSARGVGTIISMGTAAHMWQPGAAQVLIMSISRAGMEGRLSGLPRCAAPVLLESGLGRVVREMVWQVFEERANLTANEFDAACERLVDLLCMVLLGDDRPDVGGHHGEVGAMVRRYVREHAHDPDLTGTVVARELGWSLRQVQAVLKKAGTTPRELIREERLQLARRRLESRAHQNHTIASLAYACGFRSASALSTAFRERFGVRPRDMRN